MTVNLSTYNQVACALLVRITIEKYRSIVEEPYRTEILKFNDSKYTITLVNKDGQNEVYTALGNFVSITDTRSELRASNTELTIGIAGIPNSAISEISSSMFKGSKVEIYRVIVDAATGTPLAIDGNPVGRFFGIVSNYSFNETWNLGQSTNIINIICTSHINNLQHQIKGRRTNPYDESLLYPTDNGFSRVPTIIGASYDFGTKSTSV